MKRLVVVLVCLLVTPLLSSFATSREDLLGTWSWAFVTSSGSALQMSIKDMTMGMASAVTTELAADGSYKERKVKASDQSVSTTTGTWKLESDGTVLSMGADGEWTPAKIVSLKGDTLVLEMGGDMLLTMVKLKGSTK